MFNGAASPPCQARRKEWGGEELIALEYFVSTGNIEGTIVNQPLGE